MSYLLLFGREVRYVVRKGLFIFNYLFVFCRMFVIFFLFRGGRYRRV